MTTKLVCVVNDNIPANSNFHSEHGLSIWIERYGETLLFDTGMTSTVLSHNLDALKLPPDSIDKIALSHAHDDHSGGLGLFVNRQKKIRLYANQDLFTKRYSYRKKEYREINGPYDKAALTKHFFLHLQDSPIELMPNLWTTGKIMNRPEKVGGSENQVIKLNDQWLPDPYADDMSLVLKTEKGLVLICGCCHAGLLNTLMHVEDIFQSRVITVIGGTHLVSFNSAELDHVIETIQRDHPNCQFLLNHCTGTNAIQRMQEKLENNVEEFLPGTWLEF